MKTLPRMLLGAVVLALTLAATLVHGAKVEKGEPEAPANAALIAGTYRCHDGCGAYDVTLTFKADGTYSAKGTSCLRNKGAASGAGGWKLTGNRIVLIPSQETEWMKTEPKTFNVLRFKGDWILVRADWPDYYNEHGVTDGSCFQRQRPTR